MTPVQAALEKFSITERLACYGPNAARLAVNFDVMNLAVFMYGQQESRIRRANQTRRRVFPIAQLSTYQRPRRFGPSVPVRV